MDDKPPIVYCGVTNAGARDYNQDTIHHLHPDDEVATQWGRLYAVADGMGGYEHGNIASSIAINTLFETFYKGQPGQSQANLKAGVRDANLGVYQTSQRMKARMGTTLTAANILGDWLTIAHVGDSRAYLVRGQTATCLTNDHSQVGEMVRAKLISPEKARTHNQRSVLNRCLGMSLFVQADVSRTRLQPGDYLILCSDGLWSVIQDEEFAQLVNQLGDTGAICEKLVELAIQRESDDNVSAMAVQINALTQPAPDSEGKRRLFPFLRGRSSSVQ